MSCICFGNRSMIAVALVFMSMNLAAGVSSIAAFHHAAIEVQHPAPVDSGLLETSAATSAAASSNASSNASAQAKRPNGPLMMNKTLMSEQSLPRKSKHINGNTITADWMHEYEVATPQLVAAPLAEDTHAWKGPQLAAAALFGAGSTLTALHL
eukprot:CAMPEP_0179257008 /NCGR_PEP_ID=MMETSP0797-20121207/24564_1 /TAXON_ID=47934 /ORGANISM="Dinophysis acuminata, Strain DAEP01" /LENGTH=153 /DNA_ID=CAMNT_0020964967 /DNA_START=73 /DNA_END=530 /DNA_ORIENTATION=+